jgi:low temperature requirement protein LtrA
MFILTAALFLGMAIGFSKTTTPSNLYVGWYVGFIFELIGTIGITSTWTTLSFKMTHVDERMALLTLIVIGEGAIGVTKTIAKLNKESLNADGCILTFCIILVLVSAMDYSTISIVVANMLLVLSLDVVL